MAMTREEFWKRHDALNKNNRPYDNVANYKLHREYYSQWADGIKFAATFIDRVAACLANGDEYLNGIPLHEWDAMQHRTKGRMRESDGCWSLSFNTCVLKEAAKSQCEAERKG